MLLSQILIGLCLVILQAGLGAAYGDKVSIELFYESECPACKSFFKSQLNKYYYKLRNIMDLSLVPYGNAKVSEGYGYGGAPFYKFQCQHGAPECLGNVIETCVIGDIKKGSTRRAFPFVSCLETSLGGGRSITKYAKKCARMTDISWRKIKRCAYGKKGNQLEYKMAMRTKQQSNLNHVPWVVVNGAGLGLADHEKVTVEVYYESECPDCKVFFKNQLNKYYNKLRRIMELRLIPYGNAEERVQYSESGQPIYFFQCQHGSPECLGNVIETCVLEDIKKGRTGKAYPFISCLETSLGEGRSVTKYAKKCARKTDISWTRIKRCVNGKKGNRLQHEMALKTKQQVNLTHVPWVVVNGVHNPQMEDEVLKDLRGFVCRTFTGKKPKICREYDRGNDIGYGQGYGQGYSQGYGQGYGQGYDGY